MKSKKIPISRAFSWLVTCFCASLIVGNIFGFEPNPYILIVLCVIIIFFRRRTVEEYYIKQYIFIAAFSVYGICTVMINHGGIGGPLTIITGIIVCLAAQKIVFSRQEIIVIGICCAWSMVYWLVKSPTWYELSFYNHWQGDGSLTNSNGVGHYLCYFCIFFLIFMGNSTRSWIRNCRFILFLLNIWGIYNVKARMGLLTLVAYVLMSVVIDRKKCNKKRAIKFFLLGSILLEIIFPLIYLLMYAKGIGSDIIMFGASEKGLYSGRQAIWMNAFLAMKSPINVLFGLGSNQNFWQGHFLNMHNNAMNLFVIVGLVGFVVYFAYLYYFITKKFNYENASYIQWHMLIAFICIIIWGMADITLFYNNFLAFYFIPLGVAMNPSYNLKLSDDSCVKGTCY